MKYHFKIKKEKNGYSAYCIELQGCVTQGDNLKHLQENMSEALNLYLSEEPASEIIFPKPHKTSKKLTSVEVEPSVALALVIRQARIQKKLSQREMVNYLGLNNLSNYQRLEDPKKSNPEFKTLIHLLKKIPELNFVLLFESYKSA
ncbi:type II toxin-antitoxin system HicB family antitoxin [bacterium]|nr:type II toxin-antitoxin system HicB family antitoxin [bacterium]